MRHLKSHRSKWTMWTIEDSWYSVRFMPVKFPVGPHTERRNPVPLFLQDVANVVYIISGRRKSELEEWLGGVPRLVTTECKKCEAGRVPSCGRAYSCVLLGNQ